jgi:hypothetical protein
VADLAQISSPRAVIDRWREERRRLAVAQRKVAETRAWLRTDVAHGGATGVE